MKKVLIGITSKNRVSLLPKSIGSGLNQLYTNKEVAVYDDHSTDGTEKLADQYPMVTLTKVTRRAVEGDHVSGASDSPTPHSQGQRPFPAKRADLATAIEVAGVERPGPPVR